MPSLCRPTATASSVEYVIPYVQFIWILNVIFNANPTLYCRHGMYLYSATEKSRKINPQQPLGHNRVEVVESATWRIWRADSGLSDDSTLWWLPLMSSKRNSFTLIICCILHVRTSTAFSFDYDEVCGLAHTDQLSLFLRFQLSFSCTERDCLGGIII